MSELTLNKLIQELKKDLFLTDGVTDAENLPELFVVESAEVEVAISISYEGEAGLKIMVIPALLEGSLGGGTSKATTGTMRIKLSPIVSVDDLRASVKKNTKVYKPLLEKSTEVLFQGGRQD